MRHEASSRFRTQESWRSCTASPSCSSRRAAAASSVSAGDRRSGTVGMTCRLMDRMRLFVISVVLLAAVATGWAVQSPWPPGLQIVGDESPVLTPRDELKTLYTAPGYRMELVASEPLVQDPVAIDWDAEGRLWV